MGDTTAVLKVSSACIGQTRKKEIKGEIMHSNYKTAEAKSKEKYLTTISRRRKYMFLVVSKNLYKEVLAPRSGRRGGDSN